jgi:N12 class adenine-specific DNA methylase
MATKKPQAPYLTDTRSTLDFDAGQAWLDSQMGEAQAKEPEQAGVLRTAGDVGIKLAQGAVDLGQSVVGVGSLATGGLVGQGMRAIGYDPEATKATLGEYLSDSQKAADEKVAQADGFVDSIIASLENPRSILGGIAESAPGMLGGMGVSGAVARRIGVKAALATTEGKLAAQLATDAGKSSAEAAAAALKTTAGRTAADAAIKSNSTALLGISAGSEGAQSAGQIADQAQGKGRGYTDYAAPAIGAGALTAGIGLGAGRLFGDAATDMATGARTLKGSLPAKIGKEAFSEGVAEEAPQSAQEQYFTNVAEGEPDRTKGVGNAAGSGAVVGAVMGAGMAGMHGKDHPQAAQAAAQPPASPLQPPVLPPNAGPMQRAKHAADMQLYEQAQRTAQVGAIPYERTAVPEAPAAPAASGLELAPQDENALDFQGDHNMRGAHKRAPVTPVQEGQPAAPQYDNGIDFKEPDIAAPDPATGEIDPVALLVKVDDRLAQLREIGQGRPAQQTVDALGRPKNIPAIAARAYTPEEEAEFKSLQRERAALAQGPSRHDKLRQLEPAIEASEERRIHEDDERIAAEQAQAAAAEQQAYLRMQHLKRQAELDAIHGRVEAHQATQSRNARMDILDQVLTDLGDAPPERKLAAFTARLRREGYRNQAPTPEEIEHAGRHAALAHALTTPEPEYAAPNELVDAVPERKPAAPVAKGKTAAAPALPPDLIPLAQQAKDGTAFWKALNKAGVPVGQRKPLMEAFKAFAKGGRNVDTAAPVATATEGVEHGVPTTDEAGEGHAAGAEDAQSGTADAAGEPGAVGAVPAVDAEAEPAALNEAPAARHERPRTQVDDNHDAWTANYDRVANTDDLTTIATVDLERAGAWANRKRQSEQRKGWNGAPVNQNLVGALQSEEDRIKAEVKKRRDAEERTAAPTQPAAELAGEKIDKEWTAFAPETGTLGIPRADMPQIKAEHRGALTQFLLGRGIAHEQEEVEPDTLKPTQREFSIAKVEQAKDFQGGDRAILVSSDDYVLDGHHQWLAKYEQDDPVRVIRFDAPIRKLLAAAREFPSAEAAEGATVVAQPASQETAPKQEAHPAAPRSTSAAVNEFIDGKRDTPPSIEEVAAEQADAQPEAPAIDPLDAELQDALGHLGDVLGDVFGSKLNMTGKQHGAGDLLPALSKVIELLVRKGFRTFAAAVGASAKAMRGNPAVAPHVDQISARRWKAAYNAIAEDHEDTDSQEVVAAMPDEEVMRLVAGQAAEQEAPAQPAPNGREAGTDWHVWWKSLTPYGRRLAMGDAGVTRADGSKYPDRILWDHITSPDRAKLQELYKSGWDPDAERDAEKAGQAGKPDMVAAELVTPEPPAVDERERARVLAEIYENAGDPVDTNGQFKPGVYGTPEQPLKFVSGMSAPGDYSKLFGNGKNVGISMLELSKVSIPRIAEQLAAAPGSYLFVDSGAFSIFMRNIKEQGTAEREQREMGEAAKLDHDALMQRYEDLSHAISKASGGMANGRAFFVMPDIVGDQAGSLDLVARYAETINGYGVQAIIPLQGGELSLTEAYEQMMRNLGMDPAADISPIIGIPSQAEAVSNDELTDLMRKYGDNIHAVHILGAVSESRLQPRLDALIAAGYDGNVSADANRLRALITQNRPRPQAMKHIIQSDMADGSPQPRVVRDDQRPDPVEPLSELEKRARSAETVEPHEPELTTQELNRLSVKAMSDAQLLRAQKELPKRADPIAKEMQRRGLTAPAATPEAEVKTPRTNVRWASLADWLDGWRAIDNRAASSTRHQQLAAHLSALGEHLDLIATAPADVLAQAKPLIERLQPGRGQRDGHITTTLLQLIGTRLGELNSAESNTAAAKAPAAKPAAPPTKTGNDPVLHDDWGVQYIDGYTPTPGGKNEQTDYGLRGGVKDAFLKDATSYLKAVAKALTVEGFVPHTDSKGKPARVVSVNEGGPAVSGDAMLTMFHPGMKRGIYITIGGESLGFVNSTKSNASVMMRVTKEGDRFSGGENRWMPVNLPASELADRARDAVAQAAGVQTKNSAASAGAAQKPGEPSDDGNGQQGMAQADPAGVPADAPQRRDAAQPGNAPAHPGDVAARQSEAVGEPATPATGEPTGVRAPAAHVEPAEGADTRGHAGDGRPRNGGTRNTDAGTGAGRSRPQPAVDAAPAAKAPTSVSPAYTGPGDFHIADPLKIVGGGQKARFDKNRAALELRNQLLDAGRAPTVEEQEVLAGYTGWGSFGQDLFQGSWQRPAPKQGWEDRDAWLRNNLGQAEWEGMQRSIINAHYTDPPTVMAMWDMVKRMGFTGGRVLEPAIGIGNFYGMMPPDLASRSQRAGIELDPVTGSMAQLLYPQANIQIKGFEQSKTPDNFYDLVIGNWPFANVSPADRRYNRLSPALHDYFFLKALDQTRPGGLVVGITSAFTMDKKDLAIRAEMARKGELVAAFRLPSGAFKEYAGTEVVTDIIILRKRAEPAGIVANDGWIESKPHATPEGTEVSVNEYFHKNPDHVIGTIDFGKGTSMYASGAMVVHRPDNMLEHLRRIVDLVPESAYQADTRGKQISYVANHTGDRTGALTKTDDGLFIVHGEYLAPAGEVVKYAVKDPKTTAKREAQLEALIDMRRLYGALIEAERKGDASAERTALRDVFEAFKLNFGHFSESFGLDYLRKIDDPFYPALAALETSVDKGDGTRTYRPAAILAESTIRGSRKMDNPGIADAFVLARNDSVNPSPAQIAELAGVDEATARRELVEAGAAFETPAGDFIPSDMYLSGNVREKLRQAKAGLEQGNQAMQRNIAALQKVLPTDIPYYKIETQMGATWVPAQVYADYVAHMLGLPDTSEVDVKFQAGRWSVQFPAAFNHRAEASSGFGIGHITFKRLVRAAIANQTVTIRKDDPITGGTYVDDTATKETNAKIADMRLKFGEWLWSDPARRVDLEREYNEVRNSFATPHFDGSFLSFQGMALSLGRGPFNLREHQANMIWRALVTRKSLGAHEVGTGKTFTMGGIAVESRRYGIAKKPLMFAHNANSKSVASEIQMMYPAAKILYVDNLSKDNIKVRMAQIANDDWDLIVIPHSLIDRIGFKEETLMAMAQDDINDLEIAAKEAADEDGVTIDQDMWDDPDELKKLRSPTAKELVKQRMRILETIRKLSQQASREDSVAFEDMGVDMILVDEAHEFKKPPIATKMKMKGLQTQTSNRSIAMSFITKYVRGMNSGGNVHLFTGTPITNTMTEVFHMMRYMMQEEMAQNGLADWDGWFGSFAREVNDVELSSTGEYEAVTRLQAFINVPELRRMIGQYMDVVFADDMPEMRPRAVNGKTMADKTLTDEERAELLDGRTENAQDRPYKKVVNTSSDMSPEQVRVFQEVQALARAWRNMSKKSRKEAMDNGAREVPIIHDAIAEKASFDVRLVNAIQNAGLEGTPEMAPHPASKPARVVQNLIDIYRGSPVANQVVFMEQGMSKTVTRSEGPKGQKRPVSYPAFSTMLDMVERLVQAGIPREQIATVTGATSKDKRKEIADAMNSGKIRIVFGSTDSLGVGVNMQRNLRAMHHMDAPWMPGELEQRNGRGHRQGNQWNTVLEYRYLTDRLDGRRWQVLSIKQRFITEFMKSKGEVRVIEGDAASDEQSDLVSTFADAAGDPRVLVREKLKKKLEQLQSRERLHTQAQVDAAGMAKRLREKIERERRTLPDLQASAKQAADLLDLQRGDTFTMTVQGQDFDKRSEASDHIAQKLAATLRKGQDVEIGTYGGLPLHARWGHWSGTPELYLVVGSETVESNGPSLPSLESNLRWLRDEQARRREEGIADDERALGHNETVMREPFHLGDKLAAAQKQLDDLERDITMNPVAPPYWLRTGAPIDTAVYWQGKEFVVTGHRWSKDGWFVLASDEQGEVVIPYLKAEDSQGIPVYEERDFESPVVQNTASDRPVLDKDSRFKVQSGEEYQASIGAPVRPEMMNRYFVVTEGGFFFQGVPDDGFDSRETALAWVQEKTGRKTLNLGGDFDMDLGQPGMMGNLRAGDTKAFRTWFGDSKITNADGTPKVVYHGTMNSIDGALRPGDQPHSAGIFFTASPRIAGDVYAGGARGFDLEPIRKKLDAMGFGTTTPDAAVTEAAQKWADKVHKQNRYFDWLPEEDSGSYAEQIATMLDNAIADGNEDLANAVASALGVSIAAPLEGGNVVPVYLRMRDPIEVDGAGKSFDDGEQEGWIEQAKAEGKDGVIIRNYDDGGFGPIDSYRSAGRHTIYIAFDPAQAKSAIANSGAFDPANPDLTGNLRDTAAASSFDQSLHDAIEDGANAQVILGRIAGESPDPEHRALAAQLLAHGVNPTLGTGNADGQTFNTGLDASQYAAGYMPGAHHVVLFEAKGAERNLLHELTHAATARALRGGGRFALQMKALYADAKRSGKLSGMYGMANVDEFVAEAHSNPAFQAALRDVQAGPRNLWERFVDIVRALLGMSPAQRDMLGSVLQAGRGLMAEDSGRTEGAGMYNSRSGTIASRVNLPFKESTKRTPELTEAAHRLALGEIDRTEYDRLVNIYKPVEPYQSVPEPATDDQMRAALTKDKVPKLNTASETIKSGDPVGIRLDIPAYKDHGVWVVSVHEGKKSGKGGPAGKPISYQSTAHVMKPDLAMAESGALKIAAGAAKNTLATIGGQWVQSTPEQAVEKARQALTNPAWVQVGIDPERHSYFYDRVTMEPVVSGSEAIQVGGLVLVKDPVYAGKDEFLFNRKDGAARGAGNVGAASQTGTRAFHDWFGDSKVVDQDGSPRVTYHGTGVDITQFDGLELPGWFTESTALAEKYSNRPLYHDEDLNSDTNLANPNIVPVYLSIQWPVVLDFDMNQPMTAEEVFAAAGLPESSLPRYMRGNEPDMAWLTVNSIQFANAARAAGYDGIKVHEEGHTTWAIFSPEQAKSATGNSGAFDPVNPSIMGNVRESVATALSTTANNIKAVELPAGYLVGDLLDRTGKVSWWHKTVGTMDNLSRKHPAFRVVYQTVQKFIGDVSRYAMAAADQAPRLMPQLEDLRDVVGKNRKQAVSAEDTKAIAAPIFEGTLSWARDEHGNPIKVEDLEARAKRLSVDQKAQVLLQKGVIDDQQYKAWRALPADTHDAAVENRFADTQLHAGVVWSDDELRSMFHLNDGQIELYREFRAAIDRSITNLTISEMVKMGGKTAKGLMDRAVETGDLDRAAAFMRDHYVALAQMHPDLADQHLATVKRIMNLADKGQRLIDQGYAPLTRFGKYTVYMTEEGEDPAFLMFEDAVDAAKMARQLREKNPKAFVRQGTLSEEEYKLFAGVSPETVELFGSMLGLGGDADASDAAYQKYLQLTKANRSALKRLIHRKGIAGYSEDAGRVLASFLYSNARLTSSNAHSGEIDEAVTSIPKEQGQLKDEAMRLRQHIRDPQGGGTFLSGMMFAQFLGGSVASAMVNLTQPVTMTLPYLSQYGGLVKAGKRLKSAMLEAAKKEVDDAELAQAMKEGEAVIAPQEVHFMQSQAAGKSTLMAGDGTKLGDARAKAHNAMAAVRVGWGKLFAMAELSNRKITFIAAWRTAREEGLPNATAFAIDAVNRTQMVYNAGNKPRWARNPVGGLLLTFKQYSVGYLELLAQMAFAGKPGSPERKAGQRAALYMLAVLFLMGGADGLPFEQDLEDAVDGLLQRMGYNFSSKRAKQAFLADALGDGGADFVLKGLSSLPGMPVDVSGRFGMGNLIPGTGLLTKKESYTRDLGELAGPAGDLAKRAFTGAGKALGGDIGGAVLDVMPVAVRNVAQGADMLRTGTYRDARGYRVNDTTPAEGVMKMVGFQPNSTANTQDAKGQALNMIAQSRLRSQEISEHWAQGRANHDEAMVAEARAWRDDWNEKNPEAKVKISMPGVMHRVQAMRQDALARTQKTAGKALKQAVRRELEQVRE